MKIVVAPDSFKNSLSAVKVADAIADGVLNVSPNAQIVRLPMADGGEGTVDALVKATEGRKITVNTKDPLMRDIEASYGFLDAHTAVVEMAAASGIERLTKDELNPLETTTYGTGLLIKNAIRKGAKKIIVGLGGSATNDAGAGMAQALGASLKDAYGKEINPGGLSLRNLKSVDLSSLQELTQGIQFITAVDVNNPLLGEKGATYTYGPQKGAGSRELESLEKSLQNFADVMEDHLKISFRDIKGAGAAGGMAAGLIAFLGAEVRGGFELISDLCRLEQHIREADLVITGEGKMDAQTAYGKTPFGVAQMAAKHKKPVVGFAGTLDDGYEKLVGHPFNNLYPITEKPVSLEYAMKDASRLLTKAAERLFRSLKLGSHLKI